MKVLQAACAFLAVGLLSGASPSPAVFDRPSRIVVAYADRGIEGANVRITITCYEYPKFVVKVVTNDPEPNLGSASVVVSGNKSACDSSKPDAFNPGWSRLVGVRGEFVFFDDHGGNEHGRAFEVVSGSGHELFYDWKIGAFQTVRLVPGGIALRYHRVFTYHCSLYFGVGTQCWTEVKAATGLTNANPPDCRPEYENYRRKWPALAKNYTAHSSEIGYDVEARYDGKKVTYSPRADHVDCWPGY